MVMVAPLTTALMTSVSAQYSGVGSAINNAISRVGPQLAGAVIFIMITANFYAGLSGTGLDVRSDAVRKDVPPLNAPAQSVEPEIKLAAREASTDSFHLAMLIAAGLLLAGAAANAAGIRNPRDEVRPVDMVPQVSGPIAEEPAE